MDDEKIIALYWQRDESAITATDTKYGALLRTLSSGIVASREDAEECVNDTYMALWGAMPPKWPERLRAYAAATARNISLRRYRDGRTLRRGAGEVPLALDELGDSVPSGFSVEDASDCAGSGDGVSLQPKSPSGISSAANTAHAIRRLYVLCISPPPQLL